MSNRLGMIVDRHIRAVHDARSQTVALGLSPIPIIGANPRRQAIYIANATETQPVWVSIDPQVNAGAGILIKAGEAWVVVSPQDSILPQYAWHGIALVPGVNVHVITIELIGTSPLRGGMTNAEQWAELYLPAGSYSRKRNLAVS